ncbi:tetratricopeptide repeat protein [Chitinophaga dinghuensis]|uniref:Tetratricopeptide repeat protein n=1 Tax=Chitinophaga dinghuensis TaxID=1539050 RepID=A0A327VS74_9BACT|nr:tetratricopeptide repeat protein [Chitinophaga dinghuensis]RAJ77406.1 tetratricopeptide repeat protein [Chitinophaga dinghuensis]
MKVLMIFISLLFTFHVCNAQQTLQSGFDMLEKGDFRQAADFFKTYLKTDPQNRTALLCYGRAIGLLGDVKEAQQIFAELEQRYPGDFEIRLNIAESLMWGKQFKQANTLYHSLTASQPGSFPANLGYANSFAALLQYDSATLFIQKALTIMPGNKGALTSLKYIRLAQADQYTRKQKYNAAMALLDSNLHLFPGDPQTIIAKANLLTTTEKYDAALKNYDYLIKNNLSLTDAYLGASYTLFLQRRKQTALTYAEKAVATADTAGIRKAKIGLATALGWNGRYKEAFRILDTLERSDPGNQDVHLRRAMLLEWSKNFGRSLSLFRRTLLQVPTSFDANLGTADVLFAQEMDAESLRYVDSTLKYFPGQKDAMAFMDRLSLRHGPTFTTQDYRSTDIGGNIAYNINAAVAFDISPPLRMSVLYSSRFASNKYDGSNARNDNYALGIRWRIKPWWLASGVLNNAVIFADSTSSYIQTELATEFKFAKWNTLELKYKSDLQNFTASLISSRITMNNFIATYNLNTPIKLGLFTQYYYSAYSDNNKRNLLFASLYYNILTDPILKAGFNYNLIRFKYPSVVYFSPDHFTSMEIFADFENLDIIKRRFLYQIIGATGSQRIDDQRSQWIYRFNILAGYRPVNNLEICGYYMHSNSAGSTVAGYAYTEYGIKGKWILKGIYQKYRK